MENDSLGYLKLSEIEKVLNKVKTVSAENGIDDPDISFEFLIGSFFPKVLDHIKDEMTQRYIEGYKAGQEGQ